jgi:hypothetical protein
MRVTGAGAAVLAVIGGVVLADLLIPSHQPGTRALARAAVKTDTAATDALMGVAA